MAHFEIGKLFPDYESVIESMHLYQNEKFVTLFKKESRTIETARKRCPDKNFKEEIKYSEIALACSHNGKYSSKARLGVRPNQKTTKVGCTMVIKLRASKDGEHLMVTSMKEEHNHPISEMSFKFHPNQRKVDGDVQEEVAKLCKLQAKRKLIQNFVQQETGKQVTLKDIHNIATKTKNATNSKTSAVKDIATWLQSDYPSIEPEFVIGENNILTGLFIQDAQMKDMFERFPEVSMS